MKWFKFYGQDFLTDSKIGSLHPLQKLMWVGLLCIASQDEEKSGLIPFLNEDHLMRICGITQQDLDAVGIKPYVTLETFCNMKLVTCNNDGSFLVNNYHKKQTQQSTSTERVKEWRDRNRAIKSSIQPETDETNVTLQRNGRIDKNRIDKNINTHASRDLSNKSKNMINYSESRHSSDDEPVIDLETGELNKPKENTLSPEYKILINWVEEKIGRKMPFIIKQIGALKACEALKLTPQQIKDRWNYMEEDQFWKDRGLDFMNVYVSLVKQPKKITRVYQQSYNISEMIAADEKQKNDK